MGLINFRKWEGRGVPVTSTKGAIILNNWLTPDSLEMRDYNYRMIPWADYCLLREEVLENPKYVEDIWDCDNFADAYIVDINRAWARKCRSKEALFHGYIKGLISVDAKGTTGCHAWAWHVDDKGIGRFVEPQTNQQREGVEYTFEMRA